MRRNKLPGASWHLSQVPDADMPSVFNISRYDKSNQKKILRPLLRHYNKKTEIEKNRTFFPVSLHSNG